MPLVLDFGFVDGVEASNLPTHDHGGDPIAPQKGDPIFVINGKAGTDIPPSKSSWARRASSTCRTSATRPPLPLARFLFQIVDTNDVYDPKINPVAIRPSGCRRRRRTP